MSVRYLRTMPEAELIPPDRTDPLSKDPLLTWLAGLMDSKFVISGTQLRFGLDPIIGLIPIVGDLIATAISGFIVLRCGKLKMPRIVLTRMSINVILNALIGAIPMLGDIFSLWFRSNERNLDLARAYLANPTRPTRREWAAVLGLMAIVIAIGALLVWALTAVLGWIFSLFQ